MQLVTQTNRWNCGSACLAMLLGLGSVAAAEKRLGRAVGKLRDPAQDPEADEGVIGVIALEVLAVLWDHRYRALYVPVPGTETEDNKGTWYDRVGGRLPALRQLRRIEAHLARGGVAMLGVPSRVREGGNHWIVARGEHFFDPTPKREHAYRGLHADAPVTIVEAILIADHPDALTYNAALERAT